MYNRILAVLLALVLVFAFAVNASASDIPMEIPDLDRKGSLTFTMDVDGVPLDTGSLNVYYVANIIQVEEDRYDFRLVKELADAGAKLDTRDLYDGVQAEKLLEASKRVLPNYLTAFIVDGRVSFTDLDAGLYLVWQNEEDASDGYAAIHPFLISVPRWQNGAYAMHVDADPKVPFETEPTTPPPPPPPPPPHLPQTGQLNWPVPVMAITGVMLFVTGWALCLRRKRIADEE
jgi:hypothetical protein